MFATVFKRFIENCHILYRDLLFGCLFLLIHVVLLLALFKCNNIDIIAITWVIGCIILEYYLLTSSCYYYMSDLCIRLFCTCNEKSCILHLEWNEKSNEYYVRLNDSLFYFVINELYSCYLSGIYGKNNFDMTLETYKCHLRYYHSNVCKRSNVNMLCEDYYLNVVIMPTLWIILTYFMIILYMLLH